MKSKKCHLAKKFNLTLRYNDDRISLNTPRFNEFLQLIHPKEMKAKETTEQICVYQQGEEIKQL